MAIVDAAYQVHRTLGHGLLESAYEAILVMNSGNGDLTSPYRFPYR
jgi:hypothetical protein